MRIESGGAQPFSQSAICSDTRNPEQILITLIALEDSFRTGTVTITGSPPAHFYDSRAIAHGGHNLIITERIPSTFSLAMGPDASPEALRELYKRVAAGGSPAGRETVKKVIESYMPSFVLDAKQLTVLLKGRPIFELGGDITKGEYFISGKDLFYSNKLELDHEKPWLFPFRISTEREESAFEYLAFPPPDPDSDILGVAAGVRMSGHSISQLTSQMEEHINNGDIDGEDVKEIIRPYLKVVYATEAEWA